MASEPMFDEMKRYVRFDEADARLLGRFREAASPHFERIASEFYDRIREHEEAHAVLTGEPQIAHLRGSLVAWLHRICKGPHDETYFHETAKIGRMHVRIGLPQPVKGGTVTFRVLRRPRHVLVEVEDDGPGLSAPDAPSFDPFFSTKPAGTGLGLAIAHRIVTDHDGSIDVRSAPGETIFRVTMPIVEAPLAGE